MSYAGPNGTATTNKLCIATSPLSLSVAEKATSNSPGTSSQSKIKITKTTAKKKKILNSDEYSRICEFIHNYNGLALDCELEMVCKIFSYVERQTIKCILQTELGFKMRGSYWCYQAKAKKILRNFEEQSASYRGNDLVLCIAVSEHMSPVMLCRALLHEKYHLENKAHLARLIKYPHLIEDSRLSANVIQCLCSDNQDGPLIDLRRRVVGEEYEVKLKQLAKTAGMHYYDEHDLRRLGYDKTPDIKMILPFLYKGQVVNWIESKANFGDCKSHRWNVQQQLNSYNNRFGAGIIIYWFGYHEDTPRMTENNGGIIVLDDFPALDDCEFLDLSIEINQSDNSSKEESAKLENAS